MTRSRAGILCAALVMVSVLSFFGAWFHVLSSLNLDRSGEARASSSLGAHPGGHRRDHLVELDLLHLRRAARLHLGHPLDEPLLADRDPQRDSDQIGVLELHAR